MLKNRVFLYLLFSVLFLPFACPQKYLTLEECRNLAIENNKRLKVATQEEKAAYYEKKEALTKYFPELSFSGTYLRNQKNLNLIPSTIKMPELNLPVELPLPPAGSDLPVPDAIRKAGEIDIKNIWLLGFNLTQPIFMGGKIVAYNDIRKYAEELARSKKNTELVSVIVDVDNAYWQVVSLANKKRLADSYVALLSKMESDIKAMEEEGVATKADRLSVSVRLNEAEMTQTRVVNGLSLGRMYLSQLCGLNIIQDIALSDEWSETLDVPEANTVIPNISEALSNREELKSLDLATKMYKKNENIALSEFLPKVGFVANYLWTNPSSFDGFKTKFGGMWNLGVSVSLPLNFYSSSTKLNAAKARTLISEYQLQETKEKIELQVNQSAYKLNEANKRLRMANKNMEKADENLRYANVGFTEGVIPASDVLAAHTAWMSARSEFIDAQIDIKLCNVYLNQALGRIANNEQDF